MVQCCIAVIGPDNAPLYMYNGLADNGKSTVEFQFMLHSSLDIVEERVLSINPSRSKNSPYLGLLYPHDEYKVGKQKLMGLLFCLFLTSLNPRFSGM